MSIIQALILGLVQGLTEFIPVSSSGHLIIMHRILGITESGLTFDVALHLGTLLALVLFFHKDIIRLIEALVRKNDHSKLAWSLVIATIPAAVIGFLLESAAESKFRSVKLVAINLMVVAVIMLAAEYYSSRRKKATELNSVSKKQTLVMGLAQAAAIVPGVSRSGITITAGLFAGLNREAAARFSFLLAIPITTGAILKVLVHHATLAQISNEKDIFIVGIVTAFITGLVAIKFLLAYLAKHTLKPFAYYRIVVGLAVLLLF